ncbi:MAG: SH3 domain-containing protein [Chloroflexi bacterium]|nr:SH3 domain-containing protein [Chloroflexota bacterium]
MRPRRSRLGSSSLSADARMNPALVLLVLAIGVMVGFLYGNSGPRLVAGVSREDDYFVLTSLLYGQGESAVLIKDRLTALGFKSPALAVGKLADRYQSSRDSQQQQQAESLRKLSDALTVASDVVPTVGPLVIAPTVAPQEKPNSLTPFPTREGVTPTPRPSPTAAPPTPTVSSLPKAGVIKTTGNEGAVLRTEPTTKSARRALVPPGTRVEIVRVVEGEAVDAAEARWYEVRFGQYTGYVYYKLVATGE